MNEVNGLDSVGKIPVHYEGMNYRTGGIIIWGESNYDIDEFRSLVMAGSGDRMKKTSEHGNCIPGHR